MGVTQKEFLSFCSSPKSRPELLGLSFSYSNFSYMLLGSIISAASGKSCMSFIDEELIAPLGLTHTCWNVAGDFARGHSLQDGQHREILYTRCCSDVIAFAGLWSTPDDLGRWLWFLHSDEQREVLLPTSRRELCWGRASMGTSIVSLVDSSAIVLETSAYGYGLARYNIGNSTFVGHSGGLPGYGSHMRFDLHTGDSIVCCGNTTYAPVARFCAEMLEYLTRSESKTEASPAIPTLIDTLKELIQEWDENKALQLFSHNVHLDYPLASMRSDFLKGQKLIGTQPQHEVNILSPFSFELRLRGSDGAFILECSLSPEEEQRIQKVEVGVLPNKSPLVVIANQFLQKQVTAATNPQIVSMIQSCGGSASYRLLRMNSQKLVARMTGALCTCKLTLVIENVQVTRVF